MPPAIMALPLASRSATDKDPEAEITVDLQAREVRAEGITAAFELDENSRWRLLNGLDDISITLQNEADISAYESKRPSHKPRTVQV
jgi:3-isopropylmalate/(R)-2-methylmalate dehydratase small subunit